MRPSPCLAITSENFSGGSRTNRGEKDIIFPRELAAMESLDRPHVQVVHVLSRPSSGWQGRRGRLGRPMLIELLGGKVVESDCFPIRPRWQHKIPHVRVKATA